MQIYLQPVKNMLITNGAVKNLTRNFFLWNSVKTWTRTMRFFFLQLRLEVNQLVTVTNLMKKLHNSRNYALASFLLGLLQYNPSKFIDTNSTVLC